MDTIDKIIIKAHRMHLWYYRIAFTIIIGSMALIGYWLFLDGTIINPILNNGGKEVYLTTTESHYLPGDQIYALLPEKICKLRQAKGVIQWFLVDTVLLPYSPKDTDVPAGCYPDKATPIEKLPLFLATDDYHYEGTVEYRINPLRKIRIPIRTNEFSVSQRIIIK